MSKEKISEKGKKEVLISFFKQLFNSKKRIAVSVIVFLVIGYFGFKTFGKNEEEPQIQTMEVTKGSIVSTVSASGQIITSNITDVITQASGVVKEVYVSDGKEILKGDKIAEIELDLNGQQAQASAYASYLSAKNSFETAKYTQYTVQSDMLDKWDDFKNLAESDTYKDTDSDNRNLPDFIISQNSWLAAEAKYKNQQAEISRAQISLNNAWLSYVESRSTVTSPSSGIINSLTIAKGMQLGASLTSTGSRTNQRVAAILSEGNPLASFNVSEIDISRIAVGQKATITIDALIDKSFTGKVVSVDRVGSVTSGVTNYPVIIEFDTSSEQILPNMSASANIIIESKNDILIAPLSAVQAEADQSTVRILRNDIEQVIPVEVGISSDSQIEIVSGLSEGELIITGTSTSNNTSIQGSSPFGGFGAGGGFVGRPR